MKRPFFFLLLGWSLWMQACQPSAPQTPAGDAWQLTGFVKVDSLNPILQPEASLTFTCPLSEKEVKWEARNVLNPAAVVKDGRVHLFYRAQDTSGTSRIGLAISEDGLHFRKESAPVFYPDEDAAKAYEWNYRKINGEPVPTDCTTCLFDGVEDPRIVRLEDGRYLMTYTAYDGRTARLSLATSADLRNWTKHGLLLAEPEYRDLWSKSGAVVVRREGADFVATRINGQYWMYFGDTDLFLAHSEDGIRWQVAKDAEKQAMISVLHPRSGRFDSRLVEPGPFALQRDAGILLIYNASNAANYNDPAIPRFTYAAGQALFDPRAPWRLLDRSDSYFIHPDKDYERVGEVNEVCFVEGLVFFREKWFLYYGTADSQIAVAVKE